MVATPPAVTGHPSCRSVRVTMKVLEDNLRGGITTSQGDLKVVVVPIFGVNSS